MQCLRDNVCILIPLNLEQYLHTFSLEQMLGRSSGEGQLNSQSGRCSLEDSALQTGSIPPSPPTPYSLNPFFIRHNIMLFFAGFQCDGHLAAVFQWIRSELGGCMHGEGIGCDRQRQSRTHQTVQLPMCCENRSATCCLLCRSHD